MSGVGVLVSAACVLRPLVLFVMELSIGDTVHLEAGLSPSFSYEPCRYFILSFWTVGACPVSCLD